MPGPTGPVTPPPPPRPVNPPPPGKSRVRAVPDRLTRGDWLALANLCPRSVIA